VVIFLLPQPASERFVPQTYRLGSMIDVSNFVAAIETLEGPTAH